MQLCASTLISFDQRTLGTTPNIVPPSERNRPPETVVTVNFPSCMACDVFGWRWEPLARGARSGRLGLPEAQFLDHDFPHTKFLNLAGHRLRKFLHETDVARHLIVRQRL